MRSGGADMLRGKVPFEFIPQVFPGVVLIQPRTMADHRGWFRETFVTSAFRNAGVGVAMRQENLVFTARRGTLRGLHFQLPPAAQGKMVTCLSGTIYDVAVDLRHESPRHLQWFAIELSAENGQTLWLPGGFAHGYQTLTDNALVAYRTDAEYSPAHERGIRWNDPDLAIEWPVADPIVAPRDQALPSAANAVGEVNQSVLAAGAPRDRGAEASDRQPDD